MIPHCKGNVEQTTIHAASKSIITLFRLTMTDVPVEQKAFICKNLFGFGLTNAMPLFTLSGVAIIPLKTNYVAKVNYRSHLPVRLPGKAWVFNPIR